MAYGLKYELLCTTKKSSSLYKLKIYFDGYLGAEVDRNVPVNPFVLRKDRAAVIRGTSLEFKIREEVDFELDEFYTNVPHHIKVELIDPSDTVIWSGYVDTGDFSAPYIPAPQTISFSASDGLGLLKNETFTATGLQSEMAIIRHCVDKIGFNLPFSVAINIHEETHSTEHPPIIQTYTNCEIYQDWDCYKVLEDILQKYDAEISQHNNKWYITSSKDKKSTRQLYTSAGVYDGTESAPVVLDLGYPSVSGVEVYPIGQMNRRLEPGGKKVKMTHDYGRRSSMLSNLDFAQFAAGVFTSWSKTGTFDLEQRFDANDKPYAFLAGYNSAGDNSEYISQQFVYDNSDGEDFAIELDIAPIVYTTLRFPSQFGMFPFMANVTFQVALVAAGTTYYYNKNIGWLETPTFITENVLSSVALPTWHHFKYISGPLPASGYLRIRLCRYNESDPSFLSVYQGVAFSGIKLFPLSESAEPLEGKIEMTASFNASTELTDLPGIQFRCADAPSYANSGVIYDRVLRHSDGSPTSKTWRFLGDATDYSIMQILAKLLASRNRVSRQALSGRLRGTGIGFNSIIRHAFNSNREFEIAEGDWEIYEEIWQVTLIEVLSWSDESVTIVENATVTQSSDTSGGSTGAPAVVIELSPEQLLEMIRTVDGEGSLLDADTVDGVHSSGFETYLGLPAQDNYTLFSTAAGVRTWGPAPGGSQPFQGIAYDSVINVDATTYKDWICSGVSGDCTLNLNNTSDGDAGMIEVIVSSSGVDITLGSMFTKRMGSTEIDSSSGVDNIISWRKAGSDIIYTIAQIE